MAAALDIWDQPINVRVPPQALGLMYNPEKEQLIFLASTACRVRRSSVLNVYPSTYMQEAMMLFGEKHLASYYVYNIVLLAENPDLVSLKQVLNVIWRKHDILRTRLLLDENYLSIKAMLDESPNILTLDEDVDSYL